MPACSPLLVQEAELNVPTPAPAARRSPGALRRQSTARTAGPALFLVALLLLAAPAEAVVTGVGAPASALQQAAVFGLLLVGMTQQVEGAGLNTVGNVAESCDACCTRLSLTCVLPTTTPTTSTEMTELPIAKATLSSFSASDVCYADAGGGDDICQTGTPFTNGHDVCYYGSSVAYTCDATPESAGGRRFCACYLCSAGQKKSGGSCVQCEAGKYGDVLDATACKE